MNQYLIDQLLHKAGARFGAEGTDYSDFTSAKFAQLIVKECSDVLEKRHQEFKGTKSEYANGFKSGISAAKRTLDAHFGVKE